MAKARNNSSAKTSAPTPRPWAACSYPELFHGEPYIAAEDGHGLILANIRHHGKGNYEGQLGDPLADARLMAAGPELLHHLQNLVAMARSVAANWENGHLDVAVRNLDRMAVAAQVALAKATNRAA